MTGCAFFEKYAINAACSPLFAQSPNPLPDTFEFSRVRGMLLGLAIGDSLGNTSEGVNPSQRRAAHGEIRDYLPNWRLRRQGMEEQRIGLPSDDTQLAFWTLEHLLEYGELVPDELAQTFASRHIFGIGQTVRGFLKNYQQEQPWHRCGVASAGNGALMRIAPMLVPHIRHPSPGLWKDAALCTMLTHNDAAAISSCVAFVALLWDLLAMDTPPENPEWWLDRYVEIAKPIEGAAVYRPRGGQHLGYAGSVSGFVDQYVRDAWRRKLDVREAGDSWYSGAYLLETVPSVLYILMCHAHDPEEAIVRAVNDTRDNDTIAAIVGAAVGALHGEDALPARWRHGLLGRTREADDGRVFDLLEQAETQFKQ
jgi:ADP-ribosyl-[dinitrogen reductase] hydrolase